jgi:hypothetical protein
VSLQHTPSLYRAPGSSLAGKGVSLQLDNPVIPWIAEPAGGFRIPASFPDFLRLSLGNLSALFGAVSGG